MISIFRFTQRALLTFFWIGSYIFSSMIHETILFIADVGQPAKQRLRAERMGFFSKKILDTLSIQIEIADSSGLTRSHRGVLIVSNHRSFWDVLILATIFPSVFVTSEEVKKTWFLGWIASLAGSHFSERRSAISARRDIKKIAHDLREGINYAVFPEATSTDGTQILPFKRSVFMAAAQANRSVVPVCINYEKVDNVPVNKVNNDKISYYGNHCFIQQLLKTFTTKTITVKVHVLSAFSIEANPEAHKYSREKILKCFQPV